MAVPIEIDVWQGEIAELEVDALVIPASESLFMTAPVAASVRRHGGDEIERDAVGQGPVAVGSAVATTAGSLAAAYVIHAVAVGHERKADLDGLRTAVGAALAFVEPLQLRRIAIAPLGIEHGVLGVDEALAALVDELVDNVPPGLESVVVATAHPAETQAAAAALAARRASA